MDNITPETYLSTYGHPPRAQIRWAITEIAKGTSAPEPAITIWAEHSPQIEYAGFLYQILIDDSEPFSLWFGTYRNGWKITPIVEGEILAPCIVEYSAETLPSWTQTSLMRERIRQANSLWKLGCPVLLWPQDEATRSRGAIVFDRHGTYGELDRKITKEINRCLLRSANTRYESLEFWNP